MITESRRQVLLRSSWTDFYETWKEVNVFNILYQVYGFFWNTEDDFV